MSSSEYEDRTCGEEIYFPLDVPLLLSSLLHPALLQLLLSLATEQRIRALLGLICGSAAKEALAPISLTTLVSAAAAIVLLGLACACMAVRRCCCVAGCCSRSRESQALRAHQGCRGGRSVPKERCAEMETSAGLLDASGQANLANEP